MYKRQGCLPGRQGKEGRQLLSRQDFQPVIQQPQGILLHQIGARAGQGVVEFAEEQILLRLLEGRRRIGRPQLGRRRGHPLPHIQLVFQLSLIHI